MRDEHQRPSGHPRRRSRARRRTAATPFHVLVAACLATAPLAWAAPETAPSEKSRPSDLEEPSVREGRPGPWGQIQYYSIMLEAPEALVKLFPVPSSKTVWKFRNLTHDQLRETLLGAGLTEAQCDPLFGNPAPPFKSGGITHLYPTTEIVLSLTPEVRAQLYQILRRCDANQLHTQPYVIEGGDAREWFSGSGVRQELIDLIDRLSYPWAPGRAFSDLPVLLDHVRDVREQDLLLKTLTRTRSLLARVVIEKDADMAQLAEYWTGFGRRKDVLPILESVAKTEGVHRLDIVHLLPALPRKLLYTYPDIGLLSKGSLPDCHWTSLNFFNYEPMDRLLDYDGAIHYISEFYEPATGTLQYGDVLFFIEKGTENAFHSCVYIADDIVFTKNGSNIAMPWILMRVDDLRARYKQDFEIEIRAFRKKP